VGGGGHAGGACAQKHIQDPLPRRISRTRCLGERPSHVVACWLGGAASTSRQLFPALGLRFAFPRGRHHLESHHLGTTFAARGPPCSVPREAPRPRDSGRARIPATVLATAGLGACAGVWWWWCGGGGGGGEHPEHHVHSTDPPASLWPRGAGVHRRVHGIIAFRIRGLGAPQSAQCSRLATMGGGIAVFWRQRAEDGVVRSAPGV
jgi:hypothetical protein